MKAAVLVAHPAISFYQRFLSPYKGFECPSRLYYGGVSCSEAVREIVAEHGFNWQEIARQFERCRRAAYLLAESSEGSREDDRVTFKDYIAMCGPVDSKDPKLLGNCDEKLGCLMNIPCTIF